MFTIRPNRPNNQGRRFRRLDDGMYDVALGNGTQFEILVSRPSNAYWVIKNGQLYPRTLIGVIGIGVYHFGHGWVHYTYVMEKIGGRHGGLMEGDAKNLADFIWCQGDVTSSESVEWVESVECSESVVWQGRYDDLFVAEGKTNNE